MIKKISENVWEIEKTGKMNVPAIVFASDKLMEKIKLDNTIEQAKNVACLPGIIEKSITLPDMHSGYGFPIGGVAIFDLEKGIVSPGGVGYDINCGVRILTTNISKKDFLKKRELILKELQKNIPSGVGVKSDLKLSDADLDEVLNKGVKWAVEKRYATKEDMENTENLGSLEGDASKVSQKAKSRGRSQLGTLGAGNHFLEVLEVESTFDDKTAKVFGLDKENVVIMIHTGSRGLGHQVASDYIMLMEKEYGWKNLPDRELICAPINSKLGKDYFGAMYAAANFAFTNRQLITYQARKSFEKFFPKAKISLIYDIAHNIAKFESHIVDGKMQKVCIHRKGATRSFGPGNKELPKKYQKTGQPIFIPGSMGTFSYVLVGTNESEKISFSSTAHGAGRLHSRHYMIENIDSEKVHKELKEKDIMVRGGSRKGFVEEAPEAYKDVDEVVRVSHDLGIGNKVARLKPLAVMIG